MPNHLMCFWLFPNTFLNMLSWSDYIYFYKSCVPRNLSQQHINWSVCIPSRFQTLDPIHSCDLKSSLPNSRSHCSMCIVCRKFNFICQSSEWFENKMWDNYDSKSNHFLFKRLLVYWSPSRIKSASMTWVTNFVLLKI